MYNELEARLHDAFWEAEGEPAELPLLKHFLKQYPGTALELGCGSGRLLLPLRESGYLMEGLDNAPDMLEIFREKDPDATLHEASMVDFETGVLYNAVTIPAFTLQLLPYEQIPATLENIRRHLHLGGGLYLSIFIPWAEIMGDLEENTWFLDQEITLPDGNSARCYTNQEISRLSQQLTRNHRYEMVSPKGDLLATSTSKHQLTWFWPREMTELLRAAGFSVVETIGDFDAGEPCDKNSQMITVIAETEAE